MSITVAIAFFIGLFFGNILTSFLYRLPRGIQVMGFPIPDKLRPFCASCSAQLKFYEYLPLLSWITTLGKCNYCGTKINPVYHIIEIGTAIFLCYNFLYFHDTQFFLINIAAYSSTILAFFIYIEHQKLDPRLLQALCALAFIYQALEEHQIVQSLLGVISAILILLTLQQRKDSKIDPAKTLLIPVLCWFPPFSDNPLYLKMLIVYGVSHLLSSVFLRIFKKQYLLCPLMTIVFLVLINALGFIQCSP